MSDRIEKYYRAYMSHWPESEWERRAVFGLGSDDRLALAQWYRPHAMRAAVDAIMTRIRCVVAAGIGEQTAESMIVAASDPVARERALDAAILRLEMAGVEFDDEDSPAMALFEAAMDEFFEAKEDEHEGD
jgi:hypothetical protein